MKCYLLGEVGAWGEGVDRDGLLLSRYHNVTILYHRSHNINYVGSHGRSAYDISREQLQQLINIHFNCARNC